MHALVNAIAAHPGCSGYHGARAGAPTVTANGNYRHGGFTMEAMAERRALSKLLREARSTLARI
jgi:hypothetical protein